ncbi:MAG: CRISPR-associated protein Cas4 [Planctomycetota bacterium]
MPYAEADLLPISALQHLLFCERQAALIHVEQQWADNRYTAEGDVLHRKAHDGRPDTRGAQRVARGVPLRSLELGLSGVADVVLYEPPNGVNLRGRSLAKALASAPLAELAAWRVTPVEYKRGRPKKNDADRVQLCAQALCLEEMHGVAIPAGALFYGKTRRHTEVAFNERLRSRTIEAAARFREIIQLGATPPAVKEKKCDKCSLLDVCLPAAVERRSARAFLDRQLHAVDTQPTDQEEPSL